MYQRELLRDMVQRKVARHAVLPAQAEEALDELVYIMTIRVERVISAMKHDPQYRQFMQKHHGTLDTVQNNTNNGNNNNNHDTARMNYNRLEEQRGHVRKAIHSKWKELDSKRIHGARSWCSHGARSWCSK